MIKIIKEQSEIGTQDIRLEFSDNIQMNIIFGGNGDIYWLYDNLNMLDVLEDPMYEAIKITKEDIDIYNIFNKLYEDLINCNIYLPATSFFGSKKEIIKRCKQSNEHIRKSNLYNNLVKNNVITWYSDEEMRETADCVRLSKQEEDILIEFIRQTKRDDIGNTRLPGYYPIRFRMSGCRYQPCEIVFWRHFDNLQKYQTFKSKEDTNVKKLKK